VAAVTSTVIELRGVTRVFDGLPAVSQVVLDVAAGETLWLCGSNGSGKSTLLRVIATALSPTFGTGRVLGLDLRSERDEIRSRLELLGHQSRFYGDLTALENLRFVARLYGLGARRALPALERAGLDEVAGVRTASFSHGMRQRLALARCLMRDPELVLLDEPYAGLDVDARVLVDDLLTDVRTRGRTLVIASHEPPPDGSVSRRVLLEAGRIVAREPVPG
jgi:ABC-type multidrug transport system ATPase subunit